jgi:histidinol-phosphate aminotransferase
LNVDAIKEAIDANTKLIFLCSPNNPTGNLLDRNAMLNLAGDFDGLVVVDEAYIHFSGTESLI